MVYNVTWELWQPNRVLEVYGQVWDPLKRMVSTMELATPPYQITLCVPAYILYSIDANSMIRTVHFVREYRADSLIGKATPICESDGDGNDQAKFDLIKKRNWQGARLPDGPKFVLTYADEKLYVSKSGVAYILGPERLALFN